MSLSYIIETARKLGIPVIITNDRGEAPQVIMPFEDFASMVGVSWPANKRPRVPKADRPARREVSEPVSEPNLESPDEISPSEPSEAPAMTDREFVEENFFFEPLEDKEKAD